MGKPIENLTFVPDKEATLHINFGKATKLLRPLDKPIAIIPNAPLLSRKDVQVAIAETELVSA